MYVLEYLIYHLRPYGISHNIESLQLPSLPSGGYDDTRGEEKKKIYEKKVGL